MKQKLLSSDVETHTVIACFLIQEGADVDGLGLVGLTSTQTLAIGEALNATVIKTIKTFAENYAG